MKLFKEVIKNNLKMIIFYVLIGILINFLDLYGVTYYQKILDAFQFKTLTLMPLVIYGLLLIISTVLVLTSRLFKSPPCILTNSSNFLNAFPLVNASVASSLASS